MPLRMFSSTVARVFEEGRWRILATERPVVADIGQSLPVTVFIFARTGTFVSSE
jgi:hypothetical protein